MNRYIPGVEEHTGRVIIIVIVLSFIPGVIGWLRSRKSASAIDTGVSNH